MRLLDILQEGYKEAETEFSAQSGQPDQVRQLIAAYKELVTRNKASGQERNIDYWRKQGLDAFNKFVTSKQSQNTKTEIKRKKLPGKSLTLKEDDNWLIVIPLDKEASCFHGKNSDWCTTKPDASYYEQYFYDRSVTLIYCLNKKNAGMWAIAAHKSIDEIEMFDKNDTSINAERFERETGLNPHDIVKLAHGEIHKPTVDSSRKSYKDALEFLNNINYQDYDLSKPNDEIEAALLKTLSPWDCVKYLEERFNTTKTRVKIASPIAAAALNRDAHVLSVLDPSSVSVGFLVKFISSDAKNIIGIEYLYGSENFDTIAKSVADNIIKSHNSNAATKFIRSLPDKQITAKGKTQKFKIDYVPFKLLELATAEEGHVISYVDLSKYTESEILSLYSKNPEESYKIVSNPTLSLSDTLIRIIIEDRLDDVDEDDSKPQEANIIISLISSGNVLPTHYVMRALKSIDEVNLLSVATTIIDTYANNNEEIDIRVQLELIKKATNEVVPRIIYKMAEKHVDIPDQVLDAAIEKDSLLDITLCLAIHGIVPDRYYFDKLDEREQGVILKFLDMKDIQDPYNK